MASFNRVIIMGNLTDDPVLRHIPSGTAVTDVTLAVNRRYSSKDGGQNDEVAYVDVTIWGRTAEVASQYLSKGRPVLIEGYLKQDKWEDRETGKTRSKLKVVCDQMTMLGRGADGGGPGGGSGGGGGAPRGRDEHSGGSNRGGNAPRGGDQSSSQTPADDFYSDTSFDDDSVPF